MLRSTPPRLAKLKGLHAVVHCQLPKLMTRDGLCVSDVARATGLNRSTITALSKGTATRIELPAIDRLCELFHCSVGDLFEFHPSQGSDSR